MLTEEHRNVMVVGDQDQSIYKFRGADFRNLLKFEEVFPEATIIVMEQNYRSSQRILDAANAVIANNAARRPKHLWTEQIGGELITRYHAEDEHDEAAFVVHEIGRLVDTEHHRFGDVAVFYRTNAQSRVIEETLVRAGRAVPRRRRREVLRPARGQGHPRVPAGAGEPRRRSELAARRQHAEARGRRHVGQQGRRRTRRARASRSATRSHAAAAAGVTGKALGGIRDLLELMFAVRGRSPRARHRRRRSRRSSSRPATSPSSRPSARSRRGAGSRTCRSSSACAASSTRRSTPVTSRACPASPAWARPTTTAGDVVIPAGPGPHPGVPRGDLAGHRPRHARGRRWRPERGHADDAAHGQGARVPGRVPHRHGRRRVPARAQPRRSRRARGGAAALLRRDHPGAGAAVPVPRVEPDAVRRHRLLPAEPLPRPRSPRS